MVRNGPLAPRGGSSWLRFLPFGKSRNRRLRTPARKSAIARVAEGTDTARTGKTARNGAGDSVDIGGTVDIVDAVDIVALADTARTVDIAHAVNLPGSVTGPVEGESTDRTGPPPGMGVVVETAAAEATRPSELTRPSRLAGGGATSTSSSTSTATATPAVTPAVARRVRPQKKRDWKGFFRAVGLVATIAALVGGIWGGHRWLTRSPHFAIKEIRVSPTKHVDADALRARTGIDLGDNLFLADLGAAARELSSEPWVQRVDVHRELPGVVAVDVVEREPACVVALGALYLADQSGVVFKRANIDEAAALPVITGIPRDGYTDDREHSQALIREALAGLALWREPRPSARGGGARPAIGEIHVDAAFGVTLYTVQDGVGVRLGRGDSAQLRDRLRRIDAVWSALAAARERPRMILVGNRADRVTVKLAN